MQIKRRAQVLTRPFDCNPGPGGVCTGSAAGPTPNMGPDPKLQCVAQTVLDNAKTEYAAINQAWTIYYITHGFHF